MSTLTIAELGVIAGLLATVLSIINSITILQKNKNAPTEARLKSIEGELRGLKELIMKQDIRLDNNDKSILLCKNLAKAIVTAIRVLIRNGSSDDNELFKEVEQQIDDALMNKH